MVAKNRGDRGIKWFPSVVYILHSFHPFSDKKSAWKFGIFSGKAYREI